MIEYAIIVKNKTRLEALVERFNTIAQAKFYIEKQGVKFDDYVLEHDTFHRSLHKLQITLSKIIKHKIVERTYIPSYIFSDKNVIIVIGQDGLVANTAKYANGVPIIAVNPDEKRYDGLLLPFSPANFGSAVEKVVTGQYVFNRVHFAEAKLNDGQRLLGFNDIFIGAASHVSARYKISYNHETEEHSSSGIIVSTKAGQTGWLSSVFNMAYGVAGIFEKNIHLKRPELKDNDLLFAVREPFQSIRTSISVTAGFIHEKRTLRVESLMPSNGVIFSDGIETDFLHFNSGTVATIGLAKETAVLVQS